MKWFYFFLSHLYIMDCQLLSLAEYNRYWYRVEISWDFWAAREKYLNQIRISRGFSQVGDAQSSYCLPPSSPSLFDKRSPCRDPTQSNVILKLSISSETLPSKKGKTVKTMYTLKQTFKRPRSADEALRWINKPSR